MMFLFSLNPALGASENLKIKKDKPIRYLLITGCARSGTMYINKVLQKCGLEVRHESVGETGIVSWLMAVPSKRAPYGPGGNNFQFVHTFHQVRDPLRTIPSLCSEPAKSWAYICHHVPEISLNDKVFVRAAKYYYYWNKMAEEKSEWTYRVEDIDNVLPQMAERLGVALDSAVLASIPKDTHTRGRHPSCTWGQLQSVLEPELYQKLVEMVVRYGYQGP